VRSRPLPLGAPDEMDVRHVHRRSRQAHGHPCLTAASEPRTAEGAAPCADPGRRERHPARRGRSLRSEARRGRRGGGDRSLRRRDPRFRPAERARKRTRDQGALPARRGRTEASAAVTRRPVSPAGRAPWVATGCGSRATSPSGPRRFPTPATTRLELFEHPGANMNESSFKTADGLNIFTRSWKPKGTPRAVIVLVHGFNAHSGYMIWAAEQFAAHGLAAYALDLRGRGRSDGERFFIKSFSDYTGDVDQLVAIARSANPGLSVYVLGHSAGGVIA